MADVCSVSPVNLFSLLLHFEVTVFTPAELFLTPKYRAPSSVTRSIFRYHNVVVKIIALLYEGDTCDIISSAKLRTHFH